MKDRLFKFYQLAEQIRKMPYGRNTDRADYNLLFSERKGTCSTKHAYLKNWADKNTVEEVDLVLCIYKMNTFNTPQVKEILAQYNLNYIPEAHCFLRHADVDMDITTKSTDMNAIREYIIIEENIEPCQIGEYKVEYHKDFIASWLLANQHINYSFNEIWVIREKCIEAITRANRSLEPLP